MSGFNACIADESSSGELMLAVREFLNRCRKQGIVLSSADLATELDIGISVGGSEQFTASVGFSPEDMSYFSELALPLRISAYPASNDAT